jgi:Domain of unknown function (DUF202)
MERRRLNCAKELKACAGETAPFAAQGKQAVARCAVFSSQTLRSGLNCVAPTALVSRVGEAHGCYGILCKTNAKRLAVGTTMDATMEKGQTERILRGSLSDSLAAERTYLAWIRTGLALLGLGFVVARFGLFLERLGARLTAKNCPSG